MSAGTDRLFPNVLWAQRPEHVFLTIPLQDATDVVVEIREGRLLHIVATSNGEGYQCDLQLFREVVSEESHHVTQPRQIEIRLKKRHPSDVSDEAEVALNRAWTRLTSDKAKNRHIQVDWSRWKDDDEAGEDEQDDGFGMDYGNLMTQMMSQKNFGDSDGLQMENADDWKDYDERNSSNSSCNENEMKGGGSSGKNAIKNDNGQNSESDEYDDLPPLEE